MLPKNPASRISRRCGFTLVELLVVITIIGILISLLMPAVQSAREAARKTQCLNNVKQLALGCLSHEHNFTFLPNCGWVWYWAGDPDRGAAMKQPGGWIYNILPFIEQRGLHDMGAGLPMSQKSAQLSAAAQIPLAVLICPTRRPVMVFPNSYSQCNMNPGAHGGPFRLRRLLGHAWARRFGLRRRRAIHRLPTRRALSIPRMPSTAP